MSYPTVWEILDSYLNTNDYDDEFNGWVSVETNANETEFLVKFETTEDNTVMTYFLVRPS